MYKLKEELRDELRKQVGDIISSDDIVKLDGKIIVIGDIAVLTFYEKKIIPDISIVDFKTRREKNENLKNMIKSVNIKTVNVKNPVGHITSELIDAIKFGLKQKEKIRIEVDGEEDLASLVCIMFAENGTKVVYGLQDKGLMVINVDDEIKEKTKNMLSKMEI